MGGCARAWPVACALALASPPASGADEDAPAPLTLSEALAMAEEQNEQIAILAERVEQAKAVRLKVLSGLLPWLTASASYGFTEEVTFGAGEETRVVVPGESWSWGGSASLTFVNPSVYPSVVASSKNVSAQEQLLEHGQEQILYSTAQAYVTAVFAQTAVEVRQAELSTREQNLEEVRARLQADEALLLDLSRAELLVLESRKALETARVDAVLAMDALCVLLGQDPGTRYALSPLEVGPPAGPEGLDGPEVEAALEQRSDLEALDLSLAAARAESLSAWFALIPTLSLSASYEQGPESFRSPDGDTWMVTFNLSWTLFDGGYTAGQILESTSQAAETLLELEQADKQVKAEVREAWLRFELAITNRDTAVKAYEVADETWKMVDEKYGAGLATGLEVQAALDDLAGAEMALLGEEMNLQLAWMEYLRASGQFAEVFDLE
jgi:outer membrane protein TolC